MTTSTPQGFPDPGEIFSTPPGALGIQNGVFTVGGTKRFLLLASYFGGLRDAVLHPDWVVSILSSAATYHFNGVRIFATWWADPPATDLCGPSGVHDPFPLIKGNGTVNFDPLPAGTPPIPAGVYQPPGGYSNSVAGRFQFLLDQAWEKGLIVDVSFGPETVAGLWPPDEPRHINMSRYSGALSQLASAMRTATYHGNGPIPAQTGYKHAFFDIANESNYGEPDRRCKPKFTEQEIATLLASMRGGDPGRLGTASTTEGEPPDNWAITDQMTADLVAYHEPRAPLVFPPSNPCAGADPWYQMTFYRTVGYAPCGYRGYRDPQLTNDTIPIYFGEEELHYYVPESSCTPYSLHPPPGCQNNYTDARFMQSAIGAKNAGAAAYTWHTSKLFRFFSNYAPGLTNVENIVVGNFRTQLTPATWPR